MTRTGIGAHADDGISYLRRQALNVFRIPWIVVSNLAATSERGLIGEVQKQGYSGDSEKPCGKSPHASLPPYWKTMS